MKKLDPRFLKFFDFFNCEKFFEAHEVLELLWREADPKDRLFYQGLIQIAAAFVHVQRGTEKGAQELFKKASQNLSGYLPLYKGVLLTQLLSETNTRLNHKTNFPKIFLQF